MGVASITDMRAFALDGWSGAIPCHPSIHVGVGTDLAGSQDPLHGIRHQTVALRLANQVRPRTAIWRDRGEPICNQCRGEFWVLRKARACRRNGQKCPLNREGADADPPTFPKGIQRLQLKTLAHGDHYRPLAELRQSESRQHVDAPAYPITVRFECPAEPLVVAAEIPSDEFARVLHNDDIGLQGQGEERGSLDERVPPIVAEMIQGICPAEPRTRRTRGKNMDLLRFLQSQNFPQSSGRDSREINPLGLNADIRVVSTVALETGPACAGLRELGIGGRDHGERRVTLESQTHSAPAGEKVNDAEGGAFRGGALHDRDRFHPLRSFSGLSRRRASTSACFRSHGQTSGFSIRISLASLDPLISCCHMRITFHPSLRSRRVTSMSRTLLAFNFFRQNALLVAGNPP